MDSNDLIQNLFQKIQSLESQIHSLKVSGVEPQTNQRKSSQTHQTTGVRDKSNTRTAPGKTPEINRVSGRAIPIESGVQSKELKQSVVSSRKSVSKSPVISQQNKRSDLYLKELQNYYEANPNANVPEIYIYFD